MSGLTPDEVIREAGKLGVKVSRKTLYNYEKKGLVPKPIFRNSRTTLYPKETPAKLCASWAAVRSTYRIDRYAKAKEIIAGQ